MTEGEERGHPHRRSMTVADVAACLEVRLYYPGLSDTGVAGASRRAAEQGVATVLCRPEQVPFVAEAVHGFDVGVVTVLDFHTPRDRLPPPRVLAAATLQLAEFGATEVAIVATRDRLEAGHGHPFRRCLEAVTAAAQRMGATSRVLIDVADLNMDEHIAASVMCRDAGATVIQAGTIDSRRANFGHMRELRQALGPHLRLKWTPLVPSVDALLLGLAEGIDLFNGDIDALLAEAGSRPDWRPMMVPLRGHDYI